jgi:hypothetical protein
MDLQVCPTARCEPTVTSRSRRVTGVTGVTGVTVVGVRGHLVAVEAHVGRGLPSLTLTGLFLDDPLEGFGLSAEVSTALHAIMAVGSQERFEFLG